MAVDTIFLCFCEDSDKNDGIKKPYYMSKGLMVTIGSLDFQWDSCLLVKLIGVNKGRRVTFEIL